MFLYFLNIFDDLEPRVASAGIAKRNHSIHNLPKIYAMYNLTYIYRQSIKHHPYKFYRAIVRTPSGGNHV